MRRKIVQFHLWLGVVIGLLWAISGLTGALLVFAKEADRLAGAYGSGGPPASLDDVVRNATQAADGAFIERLLVKDGHHELINALYADREGAKRIVVVDAGTAKPLEVTPWEPGSPFAGALYRWLYMFHMTYLTGHNGMVLVGITGLVLVSALVTGLWIAWPRRGAWSSVFSFRRWRKREHRLYGWHRATGLVAGFLLIGFALTGSYMALPEEPVKQLVARFAAYEPIHAAKASHHKTPMPASSAVIGLQHALQIVQRLYPGSPWVRIWLPTQEYPFYTIRVRQRGEVRAWLGTTTVAIEAASGRIAGVYDPVKAPAANKMFDGIFSFHNGELGGTAGRVLAMLLGLTLPVLYVTGLWAWWRKRRTRAVHGVPRVSSQERAAGRSAGVRTWIPAGARDDVG
jgi:uncharacterized iron-regulated membrane protein